jgi:hypothetical protein
MKTLLLKPGATSFGLFWYPRNDDARELLKKGRTTFKSEEVEALIKAGHRVNVELNNCYPGDPFVVELKPLAPELS